MKFAHIADCHIGSWSNHPDLKEYPIIAFEKSMDECKNEGVDFIIIAGDLFDTSLPPIDILKRVTVKLKQTNEAGIPVYVVPGSHDYSPTGKTMISVLESAGLLTDVCRFDVVDGKVKLRFTVDKKTGAKMTGFMGRKGGLDIDYYKNIDKSIEEEPGFKIFVFHAAIAEYRPENMKDMLAVSIDELPKNFDYYATGHVHKKFFDEKHMIVFPGELFPTSFDELEDYNGGFVIAETNGKNIDVRWRDNRLFDVAVMKFNVDGKTPATAEKEMLDKMNTKDINEKCLLLKLEGVLDGKISDIDFRSILNHATTAGAKIMKKSTSGIKTKDMEDITIRASSADEIERNLIGSYKDQLKLTGVNDTESFVVNLMRVLEDEKLEDETTATFEERIKINAKKVLGL